jgi:hypothetical protein
MTDPPQNGAAPGPGENNGARGKDSNWTNNSNSPAGQNKPNREEIIRTIKLLIPSGGTVEVRALEASIRGERRTGTVSGYFDSPEALADAVLSIISAKGIYIVINSTNPALLARACNRLRMVGRSDALTGDHDILRRRWLPIDLDPRRPAGISSNEEEHRLALDRARTVAAYLTKLGWPAPIIADSGNGVHLLYLIDLPVDDGGLVQRLLARLAEQFDDDKVCVDKGVFNPSRIWKLYGTMARKGDATPDRPHRMARLLNVPASIDVVPESMLTALAGRAPAAAPKVSSPQSEEWDLAAWIAKHLPDAQGPKAWNGDGRMWSIPTCPFNPNHVGGSAFIGQLPSGAITAGCHHNSCTWGWAELRARMEPRAQSRGTSEIGKTGAHCGTLDGDAETKPALVMRNLGGWSPCRSVGFGRAEFRRRC